MSDLEIQWLSVPTDVDLGLEDSREFDNLSHHVR